MAPAARTHPAALAAADHRSDRAGRTDPHVPTRAGGSGDRADRPGRAAAPATARPGGGLLRVGVGAVWPGAYEEVLRCLVEGQGGVGAAGRMAPCRAPRHWPRHASGWARSRSRCCSPRPRGRWPPPIPRGRCSYGLSSSDGSLQVLVDLAGDVALEAADDVLFGLALLGAPLDVVLGWLVAGHPRQGDHPQGVVGLPVTAAVEAVPGGLAGGCLDR